MDTIQKRIENAIHETKRLSKEVEGFPTDYFQNTLKSRQPDGIGSTFNGRVTEDDLINAEWKPFKHPSVADGCTAFITHNLGGKVGVVRLDDLPNLTVIELDDGKETGQVSAVVDREDIDLHRYSVDYTVLILGQEMESEVVYTFHPGDPVFPSNVSSEILVGTIVLVQEAISLGLEYCKIRG